MHLLAPDLLRGVMRTEKDQHAEPRRPEVAVAHYSGLRVVASRFCEGAVTLTAHAC